ncbi:MAG: hypothetical protein LW809_02655 [Vampirovibrionales bacterium]|nr:hypothetical protein [Vampirovibrionales bacterium]
MSHGMASDIVGQGVANPRSLQAAIDYVWASQASIKPVSLKWSASLQVE